MRIRYFSETFKKILKIYQQMTLDFNAYRQRDLLTVMFIESEWDKSLKFHYHARH